MPQKRLTKREETKLEEAATLLEEIGEMFRDESAKSVAIDVRTVLGEYAGSEQLEAAEAK